MAPAEKSEYRNDSPGVIGVIVIQNQKERGIGVAPGDTVWLSEEEKIATANAPKHDADNPLVNGNLTLVTPSTEKANRRPLGPEEVPATPEPESEAPEAPEAAPAATETAEEPAVLTAEQEAEKAKAAEEEAKRAARAKAQAEQPGAPVDEKGARVAPQPLPHQGQRAPDEEVASPQAREKAAPEQAAPVKAPVPAKN